VRARGNARSDSSAQQYAFSEFIRPKLQEWEEFIVAPCGDANGFWWIDWGCIGRIVRRPSLCQADGRVGVAQLGWQHVKDCVGRC